MQMDNLSILYSQCYQKPFCKIWALNLGMLLTHSLFFLLLFSTMQWLLHHPCDFKILIMLQVRFVTKFLQISECLFKMEHKNMYINLVGYSIHIASSKSCHLNSSCIILLTCSAGKVGYWMEYKLCRLHLRCEVLTDILK